MIKLSEKILIKADTQIVWAFLTDVQKSLLFNRFHIEIILKKNFSVNKQSDFVIIHNFGFGNINMTAEVVKYIPVKELVIREKPANRSSKGFNHEIKFEVLKENKHTILIYSVSGTYGGRVQDIPFKPILKGVLKEEIIRIKNAIEASESLPGNIKVGHIST